MKMALSNRHVWPTVAAFVVFWLAACIVPVDAVISTINCFAMVVMLTVAVVYAPSTIRAIRGERVSDAALAVFYIKFGILMSYGWSFLGRLYNTMWIRSAQDQADLNNSVTSFIQMCVALGGIYLICSPGALGRTPRRRFVAVGCIVTASLALALALAYSGLDTTGIMNALRPWTPR